MNRNLRCCVLVAAAMVTMGCDREVEETVFDDQVQALEKARAVEQQIEDRAGKIADQLRDEDKSDPPE